MKIVNISIVTSDSKPIFRQIVDSIRLQVARGELVPGDRLPGSRDLARQLLINVNTVAKAYSELIASGIAESRKGLGLFICPQKQLLSNKEQAARLDQALQQFINDVMDLDYTDKEIMGKLKDEFACIKTPSTKNRSSRSKAITSKERSGS